MKAERSYPRAVVTAKAENAVLQGHPWIYDAEITALTGQPENGGLVDAVSRKYFTSETSWLWDIDFDQLSGSHVKKVILSGRYANDLAERFSFTAIDPAVWSVVPDIAAAAGALEAEGSEDLYVVTCFSDRDKLLSLVDKEA